MKKSIILLPLALIAITSVCFAATVDNMSDISADNANYDAIRFAFENNIISGYPDGTFKPENKINRAEFVKIIISAVNTPDEIDSCIKPSTTFYSDVKPADWFAKYICLAKQNGIIKGYKDGSFKPDQNINFVEAAKIISMGFQPKLIEDYITWYKPFVNYLADKNAIPGTIKNGEYQISRAEMVEMIYRLRGKISNKYSLTYEQVVGSETSCIKAGGTANGTVSPAYQTTCCSGLIPYSANRSQGQLLVGGSSLCLEPQEGLAKAVEVMSRDNECTTSTDLGLKLEAPYKNLNFTGYSFPLKSFKSGCAARCDVHTDTMTASIGWMCTGLIQ